MHKVEQELASGIASSDMEASMQERGGRPLSLQWGSKADQGEPAPWLPQLPQRTPPGSTHLGNLADQALP